jgi:non-specific serine/threonine protein kinase
MGYIEAVLPDMPAPRADCAAVLLGTRLFVLGGLDGEVMDTVDRVECIDVERFLEGYRDSRPTAVKAWTTMPSMIEPRMSFAAGVVSGGIIIVAGGEDDATNPIASAEAFDPETEVWTQLPCMHEARSHCTAAVADGCLVVIGGKNAYGVSINTVEAYAAAEKRWVQLPSMSLSRTNCAAEFSAHAPFAGPNSLRWHAMKPPI